MAPFFVFDEQAGIFDGNEAGGPGLFRRRLVDDSLLEPQDFGVDSDGGIGNRGNVFRAAEDVDDIDLFRDVFEAFVGFLAEDFRFVWINGDDAESDGLQILGYLETRTGGIGGKADDGDRLCFAQNVGNGIGRGSRVIGEMKLHRNWMPLRLGSLRV